MSFEVGCQVGRGQKGSDRKSDGLHTKTYALCLDPQLHGHGNCLELCKPPA